MGIKSNVMPAWSKHIIIKSEGKSMNDDGLQKNFLKRSSAEKYRHDTLSL